MIRQVASSNNLSCRFCGSEQVMVGFRDGYSDVYVPACGDCAVEFMGDFHEVVDALAIWPKQKGTNHA